MELLRLEGLSKRYIGTQALDHVDLSVGTGEVLCLAGANGSGKSTLMKCVVGAETPDSGQIVWQGQSFSKLTPAQSRRLGIDIIYQDLSIFPEQTVAENVAFHAIQSGRRGWISWSEIDRIASEALDKIGAKLPLHTRLSDLPIGARQTTAIARALTGDCRLLVMDEPTTALPSRDVARLLETVRRLKDDGISIIFISHKLEELFDIADRFVILRDGRKVAEHAPSELTSKRLSFLMTGLEFDSSKASQDLAVSAPTILSVENLTREKQYQNVSFSLKAGETIGFAGFDGRRSHRDRIVAVRTQSSRFRHRDHSGESAQCAFPARCHSSGHRARVPRTARRRAFSQESRLRRTSPLRPIRRVPALSEPFR